MAIFFDMDGVMAQFYNDPDFLTNMHKEGYFISLQPYTALCTAFRILHKVRQDIYILTAYHAEDPWVPHEKKLWTRNMFGQDAADFDMIICPCGTNKAEYAEQKIGRRLRRYDVLVDDHTPNLQHWQAAGGTGIKFINEINGHGGKWKGERMSYTSNYGAMLAMLMRHILRGETFEKEEKSYERSENYQRAKAV